MIKKMIQKKCNIYSGNIYKLNDGTFYINKKNLNDKAEIIEGPIFYKRGFMDLYVREINTGKIIFTYPLKKLIKFPKKYFVAIDKRGKKFNESLITLSYKEIADKYNLNLIKDANKILKLMMNQKSDLVEAYNQQKPNNYKDILNEKMCRKFNIKDIFDKFDYKSKLEKLKNSIKKRRNNNDNFIQENISVNEDVNINNQDLEEEFVSENNIIEEEQDDNIINNNIVEDKIEIKNDEFIDNVDGIKVKKYDLCKEHKYVYGFNLKVKPVINLSTTGKTFENVIAEMIHLNNLGYNVYAVVDDIKLSTRGLNTTQELLEYYNFKKNNIFPTTTNAKIMARASRKLEKQNIKKI